MFVFFTEKLFFSSRTDIHESNKLCVGAQIRIEYEGFWYRAVIIEMTKDNITIKLWKSAFKTKLFDISRRTDWITLVTQKKVYRDECNKLFPKWAVMGQIVCIMDEYGNVNYGTISDYTSNNSISIISIIETTSNKLKLKTKKYDNLNTTKNYIHNQSIYIPNFIK